MKGRDSRPDERENHSFSMTKMVPPIRISHITLLILLKTNKKRCSVANYHLVVHCIISGNNRPNCARKVESENPGDTQNENKVRQTNRTVSEQNPKKTDELLQNPTRPVRLRTGGKY